MRDEEIIELYFNRDEDAIAETDRKYGKYCQSIAGHILASSEDVEEVLDDTWVKAEEEERLANGEEIPNAYGLLVEQID